MSIEHRQSFQNTWKYTISPTSPPPPLLEAKGMEENREHLE